MEERPILVAMRVTLVVKGPVGRAARKTAGKTTKGGKTVKRRRRQTALLACNPRPQIKKHLFTSSK